jgi:hypothetical protein
VVPGDLRTTLQVSVTDDEAAEEELARLAVSDGRATVTEFGKRKYELEDVFMKIVEGSNHDE